MASLRTSGKATRKSVLDVILSGYGETTNELRSQSQPSQPVTFGHCLLSVLDSLEQDLPGGTYVRVNLCSLDAGVWSAASFRSSVRRVCMVLTTSFLKFSFTNSFGLLIS